MNNTMFFGGICAFVLVIFIINIFVLIWVYKDAEKRGANAVLWLVIVLFTGIIGLVIWLVVRPPLQPQYPGYGAYPPPQYPPAYPQQQYSQQYPQQGQYPPPPPGYPPR